MKRPWLTGIVSLAAVGLLAADIRPTGPAGAAWVAPGGQEGTDAPRIIRFAKNPSPVPPFSVQDLNGHAITPAG